MYNKQMLGVMRGLEEWWNLLIGASEAFKITTDHCNLTYFQEPQKLTSRQVNWTMKLQDYNFMIKHIQGADNARAALSQPDNVEKPERRTGTLLPESYFVQMMIGKLDPPYYLTDEEKVNIICPFHNTPTTGHPGVRRTLYLMMRRGEKWPGI
jgi:hypothetical protein